MATEEFALKWDETGKKKYYTGVSNGVLYPISKEGTYPKGVAWNGLTAVNESPSGAEATALYADNKKYLDLMSAEEFGATIEAYMYPDEFEACNGRKEIVPGVYATQQNRTGFGFSYMTLIGNDTEGTDYGYQIHLVYNAKASVSEQSNATVNDSPEAATLSWEITTTPVEVPGCKPTAHLIIDSTKTDKAKMDALKKIIWGTADIDARLPLPSELAEIMGTGTTNVDPSDLTV